VSDVCLSVTYIRPKSRTERPRKTKIGTEVAHVTRDSDTTFKVKRSKVNLQGRGHIVAASRTAYLATYAECMLRDVVVRLEISRLDSRLLHFLAAAPTGTCSSVTKQYNLVSTKGR